jgi:hypothetical protein
MNRACSELADLSRVSDFQYFNTLYTVYYTIPCAKVANSFIYTFVLLYSTLVLCDRPFRCHFLWFFLRTLCILLPVSKNLHYSRDVTRICVGRVQSGRSSTIGTPRSGWPSTGPPARCAFFQVISIEIIEYIECSWLYMFQHGQRKHRS